LNNKDASKKRELKVISFLNEFPWDTSGVVIGGICNSSIWQTEIL
jgi:hypothetical protein